MESTRVACLACERPAPRASLVQCQGCKLVWYCSEACKRAHSPKHVLVCGTVQLRLDALSPDDRFLWHLNAAVVRNLLAPSAIKAMARIARPYPLPSDQVLLISFDGPLSSARDPDRAAWTLLVQIARRFGRFHDLNWFLTLGVGSNGDPIPYHPAVRTRLVSESEAAALVARDCANMEGTRASWLTSSKARMAIVSSIDGRLECARAYMATLDQPR